MNQITTFATATTPGCCVSSPHACFRRRQTRARSLHRRAGETEDGDVAPPPPPSSPPSVFAVPSKKPKRRRRRSSRLGRRRSSLRTPSVGRAISALRPASCARSSSRCRCWRVACSPHSLFSVPGNVQSVHPFVRVDLIREIPTPLSLPFAAHV